MAENDVNIHVGMKVYSQDRQEIGTVADVYPNIGAGTEPQQVDEVEVLDTSPNYGPSNPAGYRATGPAPTEITGEVSSAMMPQYYDIEPGEVSPRTVADTMYMKVVEGGFLGLGGKEFYIPFGAVTAVVPDESVILTGTKQEITERYAQKPAFLRGKG